MWLERNLVTDSQHDDAVLGVAVLKTFTVLGNLHETEVVTGIDNEV